MGRARRLVVLVIIALAVTAPSALATPGPSGSEREAVTLINAARHQHGLAPLAFSAGLWRAARAHSLVMLRTGVFAHGDAVQRIAEAIRGARFAGEDLAWGTLGLSSPSSAVHRWLESPAHRAVVLSPVYRFVAVGCANGGFLGAADATLYTADFAG
jgi:uncharacterized protein YkwD